jgi:cystathionine beta-lyase/cystathionine gamma-synthase
LARFLQEHPRVRSVCYPGLEKDEGHTLAQTQMTGYSGLMSFVPDADNEAIHAMVKSLDVFEEGPSWGGFESVVKHAGPEPEPGDAAV